MTNRILDLCCGAGGFSCGFKILNRGDHFTGVDIWDVALRTYAKNIGGEVIQQSILDLDVTTVGRVDILIGSPPCQGFSTANKFRNCDPTLVRRYLQIRDELKPKWWVMEEVPAVLPHVRELQARIFSASDFGLPHVRKRLFAGNYPEPIKNPWKNITVRTPIALMRGFYQGAWNKERVDQDFENLFAFLAEHGTVPTPVATDHVGFGLNRAERAKDIHDRIKRARRIHDVFHEKISPDVCAFVMGFPEGYAFEGTVKEVYQQIGNAVCPPIATAIYEAILHGKRIEDYFKEV